MKHPVASLIACLCFPVLVCSAEYKSLFEEGNEAYAEGNYFKSIDLYQQSLAEKQSEAAHFNLGNAYYETGQTGYAVLHYERALILKPHSPDTQANLDFLRKKEDLQSGKTSALERYAHLLTVDCWTWFAVIAFWMTVTLVLLPRLQGMRRPLCNGLACLCFMGFIACKTALYAYHLESKQGVVLSKEAPIKIAPTPSSNPLVYVRAGELLTLEGQTFENYLRVETVRGQSGWISKADFSKIWEG